MRRGLPKLVAVALLLLTPILAMAKGSNQQTAEAIAKALREASATRGLTVAIKYVDGTASLKGQVPTPEQVAAITHIVADVPGVEKVNNMVTSKQKQVARTVPPTARPAATTLPRPTGPVRQASNVPVPAKASGANLLPLIRPQVASAPVRKAAPAPVRQADQAPVRQAAVVPAKQREVVAEQPRTKRAPLFSSFFGQKQEQPVVKAQTPAPKPAVRAAAFKPKLNKNEQVIPGSMVVQDRAAGDPPRQALPPRQAYAPPQQGYAQQPVAGYYGQNMGGQQQPNNQPIPAYALPSGQAPQVTYESPSLPRYAWPTYAAYPNYAAVTYPRQYSPHAWPYIGPFYPYPQVPLGWREASLKWKDGWWKLNLKSRRF